MQKQIDKFGLIGKDISYSFSKKFFTQKFINDGLNNCSYENYDISSIYKLLEVLNDSKIKGLNVTIPYKESVIELLNHIDPIAKKIGAVNTICFKNGNKIGYNTDIYGFTESLKVNKIDDVESVLILGTGGAAKTITYFCIKYNIPYNLVSRQKSNLHLSYNELDEYNFTKRVLIVNCTPLGTYPDVNKSPKLPFELINKENIFFDLVYNPSETLFMKKGKEIGCKTLNGYEMLRLQAEMSWKIWTD